MSFTLPCHFILATKSKSLEKLRKRHSTNGGRADDEEIHIDSAKLDEEALNDILSIAIQDGKHARIVRSVQALLLARASDYSKPLPSFDAFQETLLRYLQHDLLDGWVYVRLGDGLLYPQMVAGVEYREGSSYRSSKPSVALLTHFIGPLSEVRRSATLGHNHEAFIFEKRDVANRRIADILAAQGVYKETPELRDAYLATLERHRAVVEGEFSKQFRFSGLPLKTAEYRDHDQSERVNARVIHDLPAQEIEDTSLSYPSGLLDGELAKVPVHPVIRVFDLRSHAFYWVHSDRLSPNQYDKSIRNKLILPRTHRDLLDVLTSGLEAFTSDIVEGKCAGNVILCKGIPGVGKTLTAEAYAELIEKPLYAIHSGELGTQADSIQKNLDEVLERAKRWGCVLLLDESDVFVSRRNDDIQKNAIVAEFLRALEYFDGLLFMTTNRCEDIDEAIVSRCAAIIEYEPPGEADARAVWLVMAKQYETQLDKALLDQLVELFPKIAPRDIKMLLRLALRMHRSPDQPPLDVQLFRRCAMFRAIKMKEVA